MAGVMKPALLAAAVLLFAAPAAQADTALTGPCTPTNTTVHWDPAVGARGNQGEATGVQKIDGVWTFLGCEMTLDPASWAASTRAERCQLVVHELVHLARVDDVHAPAGVMARVPGWFDGCHTVRERVQRQLVTGPHMGVICGKGTRVFFCRTFSGDRVARYRVRVKGSQYTIRRVKGTNA